MLHTKAGIGNIIALCGSIIAVVAFLLFPYISLGLFGSYTAVQLATGIPGSSAAALWLELLVALATIVLAILSLSRNSTPSVFPTVALALSTVTFIAILGIYIIQSQQQMLFGSTASFYSTGFWLYLLGMMTSMIGEILQIRSFNA